MAEEKKKVWRTPPWVDSHIERYLNDPANAVMWTPAGPATTPRSRPCC